MGIELGSGQRVLFIGDSITDCGRSTAGGLGDGYVRIIQERLGRDDIEIVNRGVSGDRSADLVARWRPDCLDLRPDVLTIYVGINDTWRRFDSGEATSTDRFAAAYRHLLATATAQLDARIALIEPFVLPVTPDQHSWHADLDPKVQVVRDLSAEYGTELVRLGDLLRDAARAGGNAALADDGVHPTPLGHEIIAQAWLEICRPTG